MTNLEQGVNCYLEGDINTAIKYLKKTIEENNKEDQAYYYLGLASSDLGSNTDAGMFFQQALKLKPENGMYHYQLGIVYSNMMLFDRAIPHLEKTVTQNQEHVRAKFLLAEMYFKVGNMDKALDMYKKVIHSSPHFAPAYYGLGNTEFYSGNIAAADTAFKRCFELTEDMDALKKLAMIALQNNNKNDCKEYIKISHRKNAALVVPFLLELMQYVKNVGGNSAEALNEFAGMVEEIFPDNQTLISEIRDAIK